MGDTALNENSVALLSTTTVSLAADADTVIYTVPPDKVLLPDHAVLEAGADAVSTDVSIGAAGSETDFVGTTQCDNLDADGDMILLAPVPSSTPATLTTYAAGTEIEFRVANNAGGATNYLYFYGTLRDE